MNYVEKLRQAILTELPNIPHDLADLYTLLGLLFGTGVGNRQVHDAWSVWKDKYDSSHKSLITFDELTPEVQDLDSKYRDGIIRAVQSLTD